MAYDDVERSTMNRVSELQKESQQALPNVNVTIGTAQPLGGDTTVNESGWGKFANKLLTGLGAGMKGFAKYYSAARGGNVAGLDDMEDDLNKILEKRKKQREEEGAASESASSSGPSVGTTDNTVAVSSPSYFQNSWNDWAKNNMRG